VAGSLAPCSEPVSNNPFVHAAGLGDRDAGYLKKQGACRVPKLAQCEVQGEAEGDGWWTLVIWEHDTKDKEGARRLQGF
jgi:hypothetical protein